MPSILSLVTCASFAKHQHCSLSRANLQCTFPSIRISVRSVPIFVDTRTHRYIVTAILDLSSLGMQIFMSLNYSIVLVRQFMSFSTLDLSILDIFSPETPVDIEGLPYLGFIIRNGSEKGSGGRLGLDQALMRYYAVSFSRLPTQFALEFILGFNLNLATPIEEFSRCKGPSLLIN